MRYGSLFSGTGALDMGVQSVLGGTTAWHSDVEPGPRAILAHHHPDTPNLGDITTVDWSSVEPVDVITGGSPCTDVSHAGKRAGMREGTRSGLWASMCEAIDQLNPRLVVWENVAGAHSAGADSNVEPCPLGMGHGSSLSLRATGRVVGDLSELGFDAWWCTIRAADAGAPHGRARVFVFAWPAADATDAGCHALRSSALTAQAEHVRAVSDHLPATHPGSLGRDGGPGVQRAGRSQGVRGEEIHHPRHGPGAPAAAADPDGIGPHGAGGTRGRGAGPADGGVAAARLFPTPRASDGTKGGPNQRGSSGDLMLPSAVALLPTPAVNEAQQRILDRAEVDGAGCWLWTGWTNEAATPYGRLSIGNTKAYAHRTSYEAFVGPIPEGYEIDHLCQVSLCVNPEHLEAVTPEENRDRVTQRRTHCKRGHEFTEENTHWVRPGARACRPCRAWQDKVHKARKKGAPEPEPPLLPTPVTTDMGEGKTPERWDAWTSAMKAKHGNGNGHGASLSIEAQRHAQDWGVYEPAIRRWEQVLGRAAPPPTRTSTKGNPQLDPRFSEFLMGLPAGWVTDPAIGLNRVQQLRALGNGVVWQQCALATRLWLAWASEQAAS